MPGRTRSLLLVTLPFLVACQGPPSEQSDELAEAAHEESSHVTADQAETHDAQTLRVIMQRLSAEMAGLSQAIWIADYAGMTARAGAIADHPHMLPQEVERIAATLGAEMPAFEAADEAVHDAAVRMHEAAAGQRLDEVVTLLGEVQAGCVSCHTQFRDRLQTRLQ